MFTVEAVTDIHAPAGRIWALLADISSFPRWNPSIVRARGRVAAGERLKMVVRLAPYLRVRISVKVVGCMAECALIWRGSLIFSRLMCGEHAFLLAPLPDGRTRLVHREQFTGLLAPVFIFFVGKRLHKWYTEANIVLRALAEDSASRAASAVPASSGKETSHAGGFHGNQ